jgi:hypothetical protein
MTAEGVGSVTAPRRGGHLFETVSLAEPASNVIFGPLV